MQSRRTLNEHERRVVAYHEAGHALCAELLPGVDRVHKISIVPRGRALGYTLNLPDEDRYLKTREELIDYMTVLLGGRAAEEIVFGAVTTGASDDLQRVAEISRSMVHEYAMGTTITSRKVSAEGGAVSDRTRQLRDEEQQHLADEAHRAAHRLIAEHRGSSSSSRSRCCATRSSSATTSTGSWPGVRGWSAGAAPACASWPPSRRLATDAVAVLPPDRGIARA